MSNAVTCTPIERRFLDTLKNALNDSPGWGGWLCTYNEARPDDMRANLRSATVDLLKEDGRQGTEDIVAWLEFLAAPEGASNA